MRLLAIDLFGSAPFVAGIAITGITCWKWWKHGFRPGLRFHVTAMLIYGVGLGAWLLALWLIVAVLAP